MTRPMTHRSGPPRRRDPADRGSATIEAVIGVPAFLLFVGLIIFAGRVAVAHQAVESAAAAAARSASIARTQQEAVSDARSAAAGPRRCLDRETVGGSADSGSSRTTARASSSP